MDLEAIRSRLGDQLEAALSDVFVHRSMPFQAPTVPAAIVSIPPGEFRSTVTMDDVTDLDLVVLVLVRKVIDTTAQVNADALVEQAFAAVQAGPTADWDYVVATAARGYGTYAWGEGEGAVAFLGAEIPLQIGVS